MQNEYGEQSGMGGQMGGQGQQGQMGGQGMQGGGMQGGMKMGGQALDKDGCILTCTVTDCGYNKNEECYAQQIQVGDEHPTCDTYTRSRQVQMQQEEGFVANCKVQECNFNQSMQCHARGITVSTHTEHADCLTFRPKMMQGQGQMQTSGQMGMGGQQY